MTQHT